MASKILKFDLWINYPGGASGTGTGVSGSTEYTIAGINHLGTQVNWAAPSAASSDGIWFAVDGEGGSSTTDYRAYLIEASTDLTTWEPIAVLTAASGPLPFTDPDARHFAWRPYRARQNIP